MVPGVVQQRLDVLGHNSSHVHTRKVSDERLHGRYCIRLHICYYVAVDTVEYIRTKLSGRTWTELKAISVATGIPAHTIRNIASGNTVNPGVKTADPIRRFLDSEHAR